MITYEKVKEEYSKLIAKWINTPKESEATLIEDMQKVSDMAEEYANGVDDQHWDYPAAECFEIFDKLSGYINVLKGGTRA